VATEAEVAVIAPATANIIGKLAHGIGDDYLTTALLACTAPKIICPAMNVNMFENQAVQENLAKLRSRGVVVVGPELGRLASGAVGMGRFAEVSQILGTIYQVLGRHGDLAGRRVVVSAGGTCEPLDPVRHIANRSSGKMGYALAEAARDRGAEVVLVSGPTALPPPVGVELVAVETALEMRDAVLKVVAGAQALIMAAAVADYRPASSSPSKIKREAHTLTVELVKTPDILAEVPDGLVKVGFAAESEDLVERASRKLREKRLDLIVANDITATDSGFGADANRVTLIDSGGVEELPLLPKYEVAHRVLDRVVALLAERRPRRGRPRKQRV